jgi:hypothetical protein
MLNTQQFDELAKTLELADLEQLVFLQRYLEARINDRINTAAEASGLIKILEDDKNEKA